MKPREGDGRFKPGVKRDSEPSTIVTLDAMRRARREVPQADASPASSVSLQQPLPTASFSPLPRDALAEQPPLAASSKRTRNRKRQQAGAGVGNVSEGYPACNDVGNDVLSCFPDGDTVLQQNEYSKFIWNTNYPIYIGSRYVDIHLFNAGSEEELFAWRNVSNFRGSVGYQVDDNWLPTQTTWTEGQTLTHSYYFVIATRGADVSTGVRHQATFEVLQTAPPATLASQLAAASSASAASGAATAASTGPTSVIAGIPPALATSIVLGASDLGSIPLILTGSLSTITDLAGLTAAAASVSNAQASLSSVISSLSAAGSSIPPALLSSLSDLSSSNAGLGSTESSVVSSIARTRGPSVLQNYDDDNGDPVPKWAIALIAVLGLLALLAALVAIWFCLRRMRRKQRESQYMETKGGESIPSSTIPTREASATGLGLAGAGEQEKDRPLSESFSDGTGNTGGRMSSTSAPLTSTSAGLPARGGSAASGAFATAAGVGAIAALASREKRSDSPAHRTLERSNTDRTDSPHHFHPHHQDNTPPSATRFTGGAIPTKPSLRSLGTNASTGAGTIAPYDAAIMADAYRNVLRKPEFPHRGDDSSGSGENDSTPKDETTTPAVSEGQQGRMPHTPKASGTTTPMAFGDSGSEGEHHSGRNRGISTSTEGSRDALAGRATYGGRESDEEDGNEANELIKHELASEGTSVRSNVERKKPEIRHD